MTIEETRKRILEDDEFVLSEIDKIRYVYKLKKEIRYAQKREEILDTESVAEHIFGMHVLANYFLPLEDPREQLDKVKILNQITWHELDEIEAGDIVTHFKTAADVERAMATLPTVLNGLPEHLRSVSSALFEEYEARETQEAKFVKALDKTEPAFEIWGQGYKEILHKNDTKYDSSWHLKAPYLKEFPYMERFARVATEKLKEHGYFVG
jgi:5'-deoxynucleotidase YfbR-like HD superfamily hydrolase